MRIRQKRWNLRNAGGMVPRYTGACLHARVVLGRTLRKKCRCFCIGQSSEHMYQVYCVIHFFRIKSENTKYNKVKYMR